MNGRIIRQAQLQRNLPQLPVKLPSPPSIAAQTRASPDR
jgi:hypothetical protein